MQTSDLIKALELTEKYRVHKDRHNTTGFHEQICIHATDAALSPSDLDKMISYGAHQEYEGRDYGQDFTSKDYRPDKNWICYT